MGIDTSLDHLVTRISSLDRERCKAELRSLEELRVDFTDEYLDSLPLEKLRHIVLAARLRMRKR
ncbi:MAG: hypothetical protein IT444_06260 [Phycisphaeraceae bacterium]|nr:hypothetical protein [Phycisphaeraceae bacterium]